MGTSYTIKKARRLLAAEMYAGIVVSLAVVILYENRILSLGGFSSDANTEFITMSIMTIFTIGMIPLSLKLFKLSGIKAQLASGKGCALSKWGSVRMMMLCVPMAANTLLYYLFDKNTAFGYMAIICLACLIFVYPSTGRCVSETGGEQ